VDGRGRASAARRLASKEEQAERGPPCSAPLLVRQLARAGRRRAPSARPARRPAAAGAARGVRPRLWQGARQARQAAAELDLQGLCQLEVPVLAPHGLRALPCVAARDDVSRGRAAWEQAGRARRRGRSRGKGRGGVGRRRGADAARQAGAPAARKCRRPAQQLVPKPPGVCCTHLCLPGVALALQPGEHTAHLLDSGGPPCLVAVVGVWGG
jgi:hypothetical protein